MGSWSVTCHPAELTFPPLPQPKLVLDLATSERCKARPMVGRKEEEKCQEMGRVGKVGKVEKVGEKRANGYEKL